MLDFRNARREDESAAYGFLPKAWTHDASPLIGGFPAGQIAYPVAVVLLESGDVVTANAECVTIDSPAELFEQYAWMDGEDE